MEVRQARFSGKPAHPLSSHHHFVPKNPPERGRRAYLILERQNSEIDETDEALAISL